MHPVCAAMKRGTIQSGIFASPVRLSEHWSEVARRNGWSAPGQGAWAEYSAANASRNPAAMRDVANRFRLFAAWLDRAAANVQEFTFHE